MNNLLSSLCKDRLLPDYPELLDLHGFYLETQLIRFADYLAQVIIEKFFFLSRCFNRITDESLLDLTLELIFCKHWLTYALKQEDRYYFLNIKSVIDMYPEYKFPKVIENRITSIVEYICFEVIQNSVLLKNCRYISELTSSDIIRGIKEDPYIKDIVIKNNIIISSPNLRTHNRHISISGIELSLKANKLLRLYIETVIRKIVSIAKKKESNIITKNDIQLILPQF